MTDRAWKTTQEVAEYFGVCVDTIRRWRRELPWFQPSGRTGKGYAWAAETIERRRKTQMAVNIYE